MQELSRRECEVAALVAEELSNRAIATRLFISERTAEYHVEQIRNKLGLHSRVQVGAWVREQEQAGRGRVRAGNLPIQLTSFIGRDAELVELKSLLRKARLVTLTGPAGVGKTRLALKLAAELSWPDGAWFVDLARFREPDQVWDAIARGLEIPTSLERTIAESVGSHLATRSSLVVVDNSEHLATAVAQAVNDLLRRCQNVRVLATSREPIGVTGEATWLVTALPVPEAGQHDLKELDGNDSVRLLVERARLARPWFALTETNATAVAQITRRLDGIPLAIELAAARVRTMSPAEIKERLRDRFRLLTGGGRGSLPRHQTLRAALDWSYALLDPDERTVFNRLGVFAGSFSLEAAEHVCSDPSLPAERVWEILLRLVEKSMVQHQEIPVGSRYRLLETMRDFALDRALQGTDMADVRARHSDYFLGLAEQAKPMLISPQQREWLDSLEEDHENLRAAHEWFRDEKPESCLRLAEALRCFWLKNNHHAEGCVLAAEALERATEPRRVRGWLLTTLCQLDAARGDMETARAHAEEAVHLMRDEGDLAGLSFALSVSGSMHTIDGFDPALALARKEEAIRVGQAAGDNWVLAAALNCMEGSMLRLGRLAEARRFAEEALACIRATGDPWNIANITESLAQTLFASGDHTKAARSWAEALELWVSLRARPAQAWCLLGFAQLAGRDDPCRALRLAGGATALMHGVGMSLIEVQPQIESLVKDAQEVLGHVSADAAWSEGAAISLNELVVYALEEPLLRLQVGSS